jgi:nicotinamidase-related amidase
MSLIQFPRPHRRTQVPVLALMDLQMEYIAEGRAFFIEHKDHCLHNCARLLGAARRRDLPVAHFRQLLPGPYFSEDSALSGWIEEFRPRPNEAVYQRDVPSAYRNEIFRTFMDAMDDPLVLLAGLTSERACLSTVIDAVHLGHRIAFVEDASASSGFGGRSASESHAVASDLVAEFCDVISTEEAVERFTHADPGRWRAMGG